MAATGSTPIQLYNSTTAGHVPLAANLLTGELAINTADGKLYFKDPSNNIQSFTAGGISAGKSIAFALLFG